MTALGPLARRVGVRFRLEGPGAGRALLQRDQASLRRLARRLVGEGDADDVTQDAWVRVLAAPVEEVRQLRAFLFRSLVTAALDLGRRRQVRQARAAPVARAAEAASEASAPDQSAAAAIDLDRLRQALADLPGPWRDAFLLSRVDGLTRAEIAARLGVSVKTVERNIARALGHCLSRVERDPGGGGVARPPLGASHGRGA